MPSIDQSLRLLQRAVDHAIDTVDDPDCPPPPGALADIRDAWLIGYAAGAGDTFANIRAAMALMSAPVAGRG